MRVFLLAPHLNTLGGIEVQLMALAVGLRREAVGVGVFIRQPVRADHPYWRKMGAAGAELHSPPRWLARVLAPPPAAQRAFVRAGLALLAPLLLPVTLADALLRRRSLRRSWQGGRGRLHGWLSRLAYFDGLTWWMERSLDGAVRRSRPALIDVHHSMLPSGILYGRRRGLPTIYTEHGAPAADLWSLWAGLCPALGQADFIIGRSAASLEGLRCLCGADRPSAVVPQAVTAGPQAASEADLSPTAEGEIVITAIGRLSSEKGPQHLLEAFRILCHEQTPARLVLAGDGPLRPALEAQARQWGISDKVTFTGAFDDLAPLMRAASIVAHPTLNDGRSISVLEAMAWGRPVVASRIGGVPELIEDEVSGLLVPPADPPALAEALGRLARDPQARSRLGRAARASFLAGGYSPENVARQTLAVYRRVLQGRE